VRRAAKAVLEFSALQLTHGPFEGWPELSEAETIGPDRLANAVAVKPHFGAPSVWWILACGHIRRGGQNGDYAGGIIRTGLAAMTEYLHEKTALRRG